ARPALSGQRALPAPGAAFARAVAGAPRCWPGSGRFGGARASARRASLLELGVSPVGTVLRPLTSTVPRVAAAPAAAEPPAPAAVSLEGVSKAFKLPHQQYHTLKERALHPFRARTFHVLQAVNDVTVEIVEGELFGIVGRNGSGKSPLLKCLACIYDSDAGELQVNSRLSPFIELGVGFNPDLTARDNVAINAVMLGLTRKQARERFDDIIAFAELEEFLDL